MYLGRRPAHGTDDPEHTGAALAREVRTATAARVAAGLVSSAIFALAAGMRVIPVLTSDFPLSDGGLFYVMIRDIQQADYRLPWFIAYNGVQIPFAYPPLSFYAAALVAGASGLALTDVLRFVPLAMSILTVLAFFGFARAALASRFQAAAAAAAFALMSGSYFWLIMGGGLSRGFGDWWAADRASEWVPCACRTGRCGDPPGVRVVA